MLDNKIWQEIFTVKWGVGTRDGLCLKNKHVLFHQAVGLGIDMVHDKSRFYVMFSPHSSDIYSNLGAFTYFAFPGEYEYESPDEVTRVCTFWGLKSWMM